MAPKPLVAVREHENPPRSAFLGLRVGPIFGPSTLGRFQGARHPAKFFLVCRGVKEKPQVAKVAEG